MSQNTKRLINSIKAITTASVFLFASTIHAQQSSNFSAKLPQGISKNSFIESQNNKQQSLIGSGSWYDAGNGPGTLGSQGEFYFSDLLDSNYSSGYMSSINYSWSGSFNGWSNVDIYTCIVNTSGSIVACADVTSSKSGNLTMPANTYPTYYDVVYAYIVDRPLVVNIYNGPSFGIVSARVQYQY